MYTTIEEIEDDFLRNAKTSKFHFFKKRWLKKTWNKYKTLRLQCVIQCYKANRIDTETYMKLTEELEGERNEQ